MYAKLAKLSGSSERAIAQNNANAAATARATIGGVWRCVAAERGEAQRGTRASTITVIGCSPR